MSLQSENLVRLLGRYFHEDWRLDHRTAEECLDRMLEETLIAQQGDGAAEIARILSGGLCENQLRDLPLATTRLRGSDTSTVGSSTVSPPWNVIRNDSR